MVNTVLTYVCHTFEQPGDYIVALTVYDAADTVASTSTTIRVLPPLGTTTAAEKATTTTGEEQPSTTNETAAAELTQPSPPTP